VKRIVAATDFSTAAASAVGQAAILARKADAELLVVHAANIAGAEPDFFERATGKFEEFRRELHQDLVDRRKRLDELVAELRQQGCRASGRVVDGIPYEVIDEVADEEAADLVVIGTRRGEGPILLGSIAERVIRSCRLPVLVVRAPMSGDEGFERILAPTDFEEASERALALAISMAAPGAHIDLVHCWNVGGAAIRPDKHAALLEEVTTAAYARGAALIEAYDTDEIAMSFEARSGHAAPTILERIDQDERHQLVAVGTHGRTGWRRWLLGSVAEALVRYAPCSVLVVPPAVVS